MGNIFSDSLRGAVGAIADTSLRDKLQVELDFMDRKVDRLEKENAELRLQLQSLEKEVAELKAKIPPDNMTDIGPCFVTNLANGDISKYPYCPKCRTVMPKSGLVFYECHCGFKINGHVLDEAQHALQAARSLPQA